MKKIISLVLALILILLLPCTALAAGDSFSDAEKISFGTTYRGTISATNSVDYYEFTLPSSGRVSLSATAGMHWIYYSIYDYAGNQIWRLNPSWNSTSQIIATNNSFDLTKGTYYFAVQKDGSNTGSYSFSFIFSSANEDFIETENGTNNLMTTANKLLLGQNYTGHLAINDDRDFYELTLQESGRLLFNAAAHMHWIYYTIFDDAGNQLWRINPSWNSTTETIVTEQSLDLIKGTYYLAVSKDGSNTGVYSLGLQIESAEESFTETKSVTNNGFDSANSIVLNSSYKGQLAINDTKDFYRFTVPTSGKINLIATAEMSWIYYYIYDNSGNQIWQRNPNWNNSTNLITTNEIISLTNGTYYFAVNKDTSTGNYEFRLSYGSTPVSGIKLDKTSVSLTQGSQAALYATVSPSDATNQAVTWSSSNTSVATVSSSGLVTAVSPGSATITVKTADGDYSAKCTVTVIAKNQPNQFKDVSYGAFYYDAVSWAVAQNITTGTGANTFSPDMACSRAQTVTFLWRAAGSPAPKSSRNPFTDVQRGAWYYNAVLWAAEQGITTGTGANKFSPDQIVTRSQVVTFMYRAAGSPAAYGRTFSDVPSNAYYTNAVKWAVANNITTGTSSTTFSPNAICSRGQIVTLLYRKAN